MRRRVTPEMHQAVKEAMRDNGLPMDRDFLIMDGHYDLFFCYYFPEIFWNVVLEQPFFEPLNYTLVETLESERRCVIQLPAGHGKTSTLRVWLIYVMAREPQISMIYVEKSEPQALKAARAIMGALTTNERLIHDFGNFKGKANWSASSFTIAQRPEPCQWPTLAVYGVGSKGVLGSRCNIIVVDDPVPEEHASSEAERNNLYEWFTMAAATAPAPLRLSRHEHYLNKLFVVGTSFHLDDLFHRLVRTGTYKQLLLKAVDEEGRTLSPRFCYRNREELERSAHENVKDAELLKLIEEGKITNLYDYERANGSRAFYLRYQNMPTDPSLQLFQREWFEGGPGPLAPTKEGYPGCLDAHLSLGEPRRDGWRYFTGVDPMSGHRTQSTVNFACVTLGYNPEDKTRSIYLVDLDFGPYDLVSDNPTRRTQVDIVLDHVRRYGSRIIIENNAQQAAWQQVIRKEASRRGMLVLITGHYTSAQKKVSFKDGIGAMAPMIENGQLRLPWRMPTDKRVVSQLIEEAVNYPLYATDDVLCAFWFAWLWIDKAMSQNEAPVYVPVKRPLYLNRRMAEISFPPHWTEEQKLAYIHGYKATGPEEAP